MKKLKAVFIFFLVINLIVIPKINASAANSNDLFSLYNQVSLEEINRLQTEYSLAMETYKDAVKVAENAEVFNRLFETAENYQRSKKEEIDSKIDIILSENEEVKLEIGKRIYGDWSTLMDLKFKYENNKSKIEELLASKNKYVLTSKIEVDYSTIQTLEEKVDEMTKAYGSTVTVSELGDLSNLRYPVNTDTYVTSEFGYRLDPITNASVTFHAGLDLGVPEGTEVVSLFNGTVAGTGFSQLGGNYVRIDHGDGIISYYCHLKEILCKNGDKVNQYDVIALSGNTGSRTTGPHLHLGLYIKGNAVDPGVLFRK